MTIVEHMTNVYIILETTSQLSTPIVIFACLFDSYY